MTFLHAIIMGFIQGLTEFLPVSSSGHLVLTSSLYKFITTRSFEANTSQEIVFDMILHIGTLIAIIIYFRKELKEIFSAYFWAIKNRDFSSPMAKMANYIAIGTVFTVLVAYPLNDLSEHLVAHPMIVCGMLILTGFVLFLGEFIRNRLKEKDKQITLKTAILIGIAQGLAAFPGLSRSGSTISVGLMCGIDRVKCAKYSFLLSLPIIVCASVFYPLLEIDFNEFSTYSWGAIFAGFVTAGVSGYFCIKYFLHFLRRYSMKVFAIYCVSIGILGLIAFEIV